MNNFIVTNNPSVRYEFDNVIFVEGSFYDVLIMVRDLVHSGHVLINHPLGASIRMLYSPYRSVILGQKTSFDNHYSIETIENSIANYTKHMEVRQPDNNNSNDYAIIDKELLVSALKEHERIGSYNN